MPRRAGMKSRMVFRTTKQKKVGTAQSYKSGWYRIWEFGRRELLSWGVSKPKSWPKTNLMKGVMPATPQEFRKSHLTEYRLALLVEIAYERGCSWDNLKVIRKCCSFFFHLRTGVSGKNFPLVNGMFESLDQAGCGTVKRPNVPTKIIRPGSLRVAMTKEWGGRGCGMSLIDFCQGNLSNFHWNVIGSRSQVDMNKIKESCDHHFDIDNGVMSSGFVNGRAKLAMQKSGSRNWRGWLLCICPGAEHISPPGNLKLDKKGNPTTPLPRNLCTTCPIVSAEIILNAQPQYRKKRLYRRWKKTGGFGKNNVGHVVNIARRWLVHQGVMQWDEPFDTNSGRKALALWSDHLRVTYPQIVHLCGDLEPVWRDNYQPSLPPCGKIIREQSTNPLVATQALRLFRHFLGRAPAPEPPPPGLDANGRAILILARNLGCQQEVRDVYLND